MKIIDKNEVISALRAYFQSRAGDHDIDMAFLYGSWACGYPKIEYAKGRISEFQMAGREILPAFAECPVRKKGDKCEKGIRRSFSEGGYASAGFAEVVKMHYAEARGASHSK